MEIQRAKLFFDDDERTEEVQHIIERMPTKFGVVTTLIVFLIFSFMLFFGCIVRYPDIIQGQITINAKSAPVKLISNSNGKLRIGLLRSMQYVKEGESIAYIQNSANPNTVDFVDSLLKTYNPTNLSILELNNKLPKNLSLGELNVKYYDFSSRLQQFLDYNYNRLYDNKEKNLDEILKDQQNAVISAKEKIRMAKNTMVYAHKFYYRDSTLFLKRVISESELDKTQMSYIATKDSYQNAINNLSNATQQLYLTESKIQDLGVEKPQKKKELHLALISSYNDLIDNIKIWRQKYVFEAPFTGKVQFQKFYTDGQFVQSGEPIFNVIPEQDKIFGQVIVPSLGSGKIHQGQQVIVKLDNYPFNEYGSITGIVNSISLSTSIVKMNETELDTYQVLIDFPNNLKTNYNTKLTFKPEAKGVAEIITDDKRLIERLFDNLKYVVKN